MRLRFVLSVLAAGVMTSALAAAEGADKPKVIPNINRSTEYPNVYHSPSADSTPPAFRSIFQMEVVVKRGEEEAGVVYANGTVVTEKGHIASVIDVPNATTEDFGGIVSASVLTLDGGGAEAKLVSWEPAYGVAVFQVEPPVST